MTQQAIEPARPTLVSSALATEGQRLRARNSELLMHAQQMQAARDNLAELYDNAAGALLSLSSTCLIRTANLAAAELLGRERTGLVGLPLRLLVHRQDRAELRRILSAADVAASTTGVRVLTREGAKRCCPEARRSNQRPGVIYLMLLPEHAADGRG